MTHRILYLSPVGQLGGAERCLLTMIRALQRADNNFEPHLLACGEGPLLDHARRAGAQVHSLPLPASLAAMGETGLKHQAGRLHSKARLTADALAGWTEAAAYRRQLRGAIERIAPCLIHSNGIKTHLLTGLLKPLEAPVLWHIHDFLSHRALMRWLLRPLSADMSGGIAISQAVARDTGQILPRLPIHILLNAIDIHRFTPGPGNGPELDRLAGLPAASEAVLRIGLIAAYARWKGQDVFLEAAARLLGRNHRSKVRFYIIGGPIYRTQGSQFTREELQDRARQLGIACHVGFIGFQEETPPLYRALDVVVHASTRPEPFGLTIAEAMACARPVIVSQAGGAAELFTHEQDALGVRPGDAEALEEAMERLLREEALRLRLQCNARKTAEARFNPSRLGRQLRDLYHLYGCR